MLGVLLNFVAKGATLSSARSRDICSSQWECTASQIEAPICTLSHNNSSVHRKPCDIFTSGFPRIESIEKVLNFKIGFQDLDKVFKWPKYASSIAKVWKL